MEFSCAQDRAMTWIEAWNSHDLEVILALYHDDAVMASPYIADLGIAATGALRGKSALRSYWSGALQRKPNLHFRRQGIFAGADSLVVTCFNEADRIVAQFLRYGADGLIVQGAAQHGR
ncbi:MAG: nuclear transport factor 2 family protein [Minwuia sp.]|nr:nuclear transport factor 2 family protein [Minwuia sp.]